MGGKVAKGHARISQQGRKTTIRQTSKRAVIDWKSFNTGRNRRVVFDQPGKSSATLNRVGSAGASVIKGAIKAPGTVIIQNSAGVIFTGTSRVDTGGLIATSQGINAERFQQTGNLRISGGERPGASVVNRGAITIGNAGLAALVGGNVENAGTIVAKRGTVALASGNKTTIDLSGDGMLRIAVSGSGPKGGSVSNSGMIDAGQGRVLLSAGGASGALNGVINTSGVIRATSARGKGGRIRLDGAREGQVTVSGSLNASGGGNGGSVTVTGGQIGIARSARMEAGGGRNGGSVQIGGGRGGAGPLPRAGNLVIESGARISANGKTGTGGRIIAWSDGNSFFDGSASATGAVSGGFVETSGLGRLGVGKNASVALGPGGEWLLDPRDINIVTSGASPIPPGTVTPPPGTTAYKIDRDALEATLDAGGDITVSTVQPASTMPGDITVSSSIIWTGTGALSLEAERDVVIRNRIRTARGDFSAQAGRDISTRGNLQSTSTAGLALNAAGNVSLTRQITGKHGDLSIQAGGSVFVNHRVRTSGTGNASMTAATGDISITDRNSGSVVVSTNSGDLGIEATAGSVLIRRSNAAGSGNIQVYSLSGDLDITAGTEIFLRGSDRRGGWVRAGRPRSSSDVRLAAPKITLRGGTERSTQAEVRAEAGGSIAMLADEITIQNTAGGSPARISAYKGASLTMQAAAQTWNGTVRAGTNSDGGGDVLLSGAITAGVRPFFALADGSDFTLAAQTPDAVASSYFSTLPLVVDTGGTGAISLAAPMTARTITLRSEERVSLTGAAKAAGTDPGTPVVLVAGRGFHNDAGPDALEASAAGARWLVYLDALDGLTGTAPSPREFDLYGRTYAADPPGSLGFAGNRMVYGERPVLGIAGETASKSYGTAVSPGYEVAGLRPDDSLADALASGPDVTSAGAPAAASPGAYATQVAAAASDQGYILTLSDGTLTVNPAALTVTADDAARTYGDANPAFSAVYSGFVLGQDASDLSGALAITTPATQTSDAGSYAITPGGQSSPNYNIDWRDGTLTVDPAPLTVTADDAARSYGASNPAFSAGYAGFVLGQDASDLSGTLNVSTPAVQTSDAGSYVLTPGGQSSGNYAITWHDGTLTIDPAALSITADDAARTYGAANPAFGATYSGFVLGQDAGDLAGTPDVSTPATQASDAGGYVLTPGGQSSGNYAITWHDGLLTVNPAALSITADDAARLVDQPDPAFSATYAGFVLGQDAGDLSGTLDLSTTATTGSPAGQYAITPSGQKSANYAIEYVDGTLLVAADPQPVRPPGLSPLNHLTDRFEPDAARTAIDSPFALAYSGGGSHQVGFVPAAGNGAQAPAGPCAIPVNLGRLAGCDRDPVR